MNNAETKSQLFSEVEMAQCAVKAAYHFRRWLLVVPLKVIALCLIALQCAVGYVEFEIVYQVFSFVSGEEGYYNAYVMACTGLLMILGFHTLAIYKPHSLAVKFVTFLASFFIILYGLGLGFLLMSMLYIDGLAELVQSAVVNVFADDSDAVTHWIDAFFETYANPLSVLVFALAVGGLTITNLFISHHVMSAIKDVVTSIYMRITVYRCSRRDYKIIKRAQKRFREIASERTALSKIDDNRLAQEIASEALVQIEQALAPHKAVLKQYEYANEPTRFEFPETTPPDPKKLATDIKRLESITVETIFNTLNTQSYT